VSLVVRTDLLEQPAVALLVEQLQTQAHLLVSRSDAVKRVA